MARGGGSNVGGCDHFVSLKRVQYGVFVIVATAGLLVDPSMIVSRSVTWDQLTVTTSKRPPGSHVIGTPNGN